MMGWNYGLGFGIGLLGELILMVLLFTVVEFTGDRLRLQSKVAMACCVFAPLVGYGTAITLFAKLVS